MRTGAEQERQPVQLEVRPGAVVLLSSDWRAELWPVRGGHPGPGYASWPTRYLDGPCTFLVLARERDAAGFDFDDLLVLTADGATGWTYLDPAHVPGAVQRPRLTAHSQHETTAGDAQWV